jgi:hypothetical protein
MNGYKDPATLGELNLYLGKLAIATRLTPVSLRRLFAAAATADQEGRDRVMEALRLASHPEHKGSLSAKGFLAHHVRAAIKSAGENAVVVAPSTPSDECPRQAPLFNNNVAQFDWHARHRARWSGTALSQRLGCNSGDLPNSLVLADEGSVSSNNVPERLQVKAFGKRAAFCAESDVTRREVPTVRFELASAIGEKTFDWKNKLTIQLTQDEIIEAAAVLFGFAPKVEFRNHGEDAKWLSIEHQGNSVCIRGGSKQPNSMRLVPIGVGRTTALAALLTAQLDKALFGVGTQGALIPLLSRIAGVMMTSTSRRSANS